jgi:hypothetical protein
VDRLPIEQRLINYFLAMGAHETPSQEVLDNTTLSFQLGNDRISLSVLTAKEMIQRNRIIETLLHASSLRSLGTRFYVAAPKLLGAAIDAQIFRSHGIGLLLFDDRMIEETVKPPITQPQSQPPAPTSASPDSTLLSELATLKSSYVELEMKMERVMADFRSWKENTSMPPPPFLRPEDTSFEPIHSPPFSLDMPRNSLPSFFTDNPWLDVLSRRGRFEVAQFAG